MMLSSRSLRAVGLAIIVLLHGAALAQFLPVDAALDVDGDGADDLILFNEASRSWRVIRLDGSFIVDGVAFGTPGAIPLAGYLGDSGTVALSLYQPVRGLWRILRSFEPDDSGVFPETEFSVCSQAIPLVGRFVVSEQDSLALFDAREGTWRVWSAVGEVLVENIRFGAAHMQFRAGDVTGDGRSELIGYDEGRSSWHIYSFDQQEVRVLPSRYQYGTPVIRDFDGNGRADLGLWMHGGEIRVVDAIDGTPVRVPTQFGDYYAYPAHAAYEGGAQVNLSYFSVNRGVWHVLLDDGTAVTPTERR